MNIWAIGDLHLSFDREGSLQKPMEVFGDLWQDHPRKIAASWQSCVREEDWVLIAGDTSWALKTEQAVYDLEWLKKLPGQKVLVKGNHDYWWQSKTKTAELLAPMQMVYNDAVEIEDYVLCGGRGYQNEDGREDRKLENRELLRLEESLKRGKESGREIIVFMHYPPYGANGEDNSFSALLRKYGVKLGIYGHLHKNTKSILRRSIGTIPLYPVSADYLDFKLQLII